jgi:hypothetical protein
MNRDEKRERPPENEAPQRLIDALKSRYSAHVAVPEAVDRTVLLRARSRMLARRRRLIVLRWSGVAAAAAASLILALTLFRNPADKAAPPMVAAAEDCNVDGRVDILDAFVLAKSIEAAGAPAARFDFTGDALVDKRDVDAVAMVAVRLDRGKVL